MSAYLFTLPLACLLMHLAPDLVADLVLAVAAWLERRRLRVTTRPRLPALSPRRRGLP